MAKPSSRKVLRQSTKVSGHANLARGTSRKTAKATRVRKIASRTAELSDQTMTQRAGSKQARVLEMLSQPGGASIAAIMKETGWQAHSVRGFLAGIVRKKLKLSLTSDAADTGRVYTIAGNAGLSAGDGSKPVKRAA